MERAPVLCQNLYPHPSLMHFHSPYLSELLHLEENLFSQLARRSDTATETFFMCWSFWVLFQARFATDLAHRLPYNKTLNKPTVQSDYLNHFIWMNTHTKNMASNPSSNRKIVGAKPSKQKLC